MSAEQTAIETAELLKLWSVTELIKSGLGTGRGLVNWNCEQTAIASLDQRDVIDAMLKTKTREEVVKWIANERWSVTERAQIRGKLVHHYAEQIAKGADPGAIEPQYQPYVEQLLRWLRTWRPEYLMAEAPVFNRTEGYAGTCDGIMALVDATGERRRLIFDYKTTAKGPDAKSRPPYSEVSLQLSAYAHAEVVDVLREPDPRADEFKRRYYEYDPTRPYEPMPPVDAGLCIVVSPYDCFAQFVSIGETPWRAFLHVRDAAMWQERLWRDAFGQKLVARTNGSKP